jgi:hypothetical protein
LDRATRLSAQTRYRSRRTVINTSSLIVSLPSAIRLVRFFQVVGAEPTRRPK